MRPGSSFSGNDTRPAGHIFFIPSAERAGDDTKNRPHFLVNRCDPASDPFVMATLAHMTTKGAEIFEYGSSGYEIAGPSRGPRHGGDGQFVVASRLIPRVASRLTQSHLSATDVVRHVRSRVLQAVGIGQGVAAPGDGSVRGNLVRVLDPRAGFGHGIIVTAHEYSRRRRFQIIVPVIDRVSEDGLEELEVTRWDILPESRAWPHHLPIMEPMLDTAGLISLTEEWKASRDPRTWLRKQIEVTNVVIDGATLAEIDTRIGERFRQ